MRKFRHEFVVKAGIDHVWDFFIDPKHFEMISPPDLDERLIRTSSARLAEGTEVWLSTSLFRARVWHARIVRFAPYEYVDLINDCFFKTWTHTHKFISIDKDNTLAIDEILFECRYSIFGRIAEAIISSKLCAIFRYREVKAKEILEVAN